MEGKLRRIIVIVSNDISTDQRMSRICGTLHENGYQVELIGRKLKASPDLTSKPYIQTRLKLFFTKGVVFYLELNFRLFLRLLFQKTDIVYSVDADTLVAGSWIKIVRKVKLVFDAHELFSEVPELENRGIKKKVWQMVEKLGIQSFADLRITVSDSVASHYTSLYGKDFIVVRNCPSALSFIPRDKKEQYILYQGALNEGRGLEALIMASKHIEMIVKIAGSGDLEEKLKNLVIENGLEKKVVFLGKVMPENLREITQNAWLGYNLLEKKGLSYYYSLSNKTFDYMHAGVPQLIPDFPEYSLLNQTHNFGLVAESEISSIVNAVQLLQKNSILYDQLKQGSIHCAKTCIWEKEKEILLKAFLIL